MSEKGRGRLSSIDLLPESADEEIAWVSAELRDHKRSQKDILREFNARLADKGIGSISVGTFSRYSVGKAKRLRAIDAERRVSAEIIEALGTQGSDDLTVMIAETIKSLISKKLDVEKLEAKEILALSKASETAIKTIRMSAAHRENMEKKITAAKVEVIDKVGTEAGLSKQQLAQLKRDLLGMKKS